MAVVISQFYVLLSCLVIVGITTSFARDQLHPNGKHRPSKRPGHASFSDEVVELHIDRPSNNDSPSQHALPLRSEVASIAMGLAGGFFGFKNSIVNCYKSLLQRIGHSFNRQIESNGLRSTDHHKMMFVFGDSLFDAGNNKFVDGASSPYTVYPYGFTYFSNATGRVCDGRIVPDFIAEFANLPLIPPSLQPGADFSYGVNFASAPATVLDSYNTSSLALNLRSQLSQFKGFTKKLDATLGSNQTRKLLGKAVYLFSIGGDDYLDYYDELYEEGRSPTWSEQQQQVNAVVGNLTEALIEIYEEGARKIVFQNVGPMGCLPLVELEYPELNGTCAPELLSMPVLHNNELYLALTYLAERLEGFKFSVFDYFPALFDRIKHPSTYGFEFGSTPCFVSSGDGYNGVGSGSSESTTVCEYPSAYLFFDQGHTTQRANEQLAKLIWNGDPSVTRPYNVKQLFEDDN